MNSRAWLILINGVPGTGKSTLAAKLQHDLQLPTLGKDQIKEWLFDTIHEPAADVTKLLGKTASHMLYTFAEDFLADGRPVIIESAFVAEFARKELGDVLDRTGSACLELYCITEAKENRRRFNQRISDKQRHAVHTDVELLLDDGMLRRYEPLAIGEVMTVDTSQFGDAEYQQLVSRIHGELKNA